MDGTALLYRCNKLKAMAKKPGIGVRVDANSVQRTQRAFDSFGEAVKKGVRNKITETGYLIRTDAQRGAPVLYGLLRSSIYIDNRGRMLADAAPSDPRGQFVVPFPRSLPNGSDVLVGSALRYANRMEHEHPTKSGFLQNAFDRHAPKALEEIEALLNREAK